MSGLGQTVGVRFMRKGCSVKGERFLFFQRFVTVLTCVLLPVGTALAQATPAPQWLALAKGSAQDTVEIAAQPLPGHDGLALSLAVPGATLGSRMAADGHQYDTLAVAGCGLTADHVGEPALPFRSFFVEIPSGVAVKVVLGDLAPVSLGTDFRVEPLQPRPPDTGEALPFVRNDDIYRCDAFFPSMPVTVSEPGCIRGRRVVAVKVFPLQYNPGTGELRGYGDLRFKLAFDGRAEASGEARKARLASPLFEQIAQKAIVNFEPAETAFSVAREDSGTGNGADYLVIAADSLYEAILPLAEWKHRKGFRTRVVKMSEVGTSHVHIAACIQNAYDTWSPAPTYVLLVGDQQDVPGFNIVGHPYHGTTHNWPSDHPYACVDGSEYYTPDLVIGRLAVHTEAQATTVVNKILHYDRTPDMGAWYDDVLAAAYLQDYNDNNYVADRFFMETAITAYHYLVNTAGFQGHTALNTDYWPLPTTTWQYNPGQSWYPHREQLYQIRWGAAPYPAPIPAWVVNLWTSSSQATSDVTAAVNGGVGLVLHRDHGAETGWGDPPYYVSHVNALSNGVRTPVVLSMNCLTGAFDYSSDSFAEAWQKRANGGAVGLIAATRVSYSGDNDLLTHGIFDCLFPDYDTSYGNTTYPHSRRPAEAMLYGKYYMHSWMGSGDELTFNLFHWFGDPEMMLRTNTPAAPTVSHPALVPSSVAADVTTMVTVGGLPVEGARVTLSLAGNEGQYWTGLTDASGALTFAGITLTEVADYDLVATGQDLVPYEGVITSAPSSEGVIRFDRGTYSCSDAVQVTLVDNDLAGSGSFETTITTALGDEETVLLAEVVSGVFRQSIEVESGAVNPQDGQLQVAHGDTIEVLYEDANNGGGVSATVAASAVFDCAGPVISDVQVIAVGKYGATVAFDTDEPAVGLVRCGLTCGGPYVAEPQDTERLLSHSLPLTGLAPDTGYYLEIQSRDALGNTSSDTNGGVCYTFSTIGNWKVPFCDDFEAGNLDKWELNNGASGDTPLVEIDGTPIGVSPHSGQYVARLGDSTDGGEPYAVSTMDLVLDLREVRDAALTFWWATYSLAASSNEYIALDVFDGTWHQTVESSVSMAWEQGSVDLSAYNMINGFIVRFRSRMNFTETSDAAYVDDVCVTGTPSVGLSIDPLEDYRTSGYMSGPFTPAGKAYTLRNTTGSPIEWSVDVGESWLEVHDNTGVLAPAASQVVQVALTGEADTLGPGEYSDAIVFSDLTHGEAYSANADLEVAEPLDLTPANGYAPFGTEGGPFWPESREYVLTNLSPKPAAWSASSSHPWVMAVPNSGTLDGGEQVSLTVLPTLSAAALSAGAYTAAIHVTNTASGASFDRAVTLNVSPAVHVIPADGFEASGYHGGPFSPSATAYTLTNTGEGVITWTAESTEPWISLSAASGALAPLGDAAVGMSLNPQANALAVGEHTALLTIRDVTFGSQFERLVEVTVQDPMAVEPGETLAPAGPWGGPFSPDSQTYTISNVGTCVMQWFAATSQPWLSAEPPNGSLSPGEHVSVAVHVTPGADSLLPGMYAATATFTNATAGTKSVRDVSLTVRGVSTFSWAPVPSPQHAGTPFAVELTAMDSTGAAVPGFPGPVNLAGYRNTNQLPFPPDEEPFPIEPSETGTFVNGVWTGAVTPLGTGSSIFLRVELAGTEERDSNLFDVEAALAEVTHVGTSHADGLFGVDEVIDMEVRFSVPVRMTGPATLDLFIGNELRSVPCIAGDGTDTLVFRYVVAEGDVADPLDYSDSGALQGVLFDAATGTQPANVTLPARGAPGSLGANSNIRIDGIAPSITVTPLLTNSASPELAGTVDDPDAAVSVSVAGQTQEAVNAGNGSWTLPEGIMHPLAEGVHEVMAAATDLAGNRSTDTTSDELTIDLTAPSAAITRLNPSPTSADSVAFNVLFSERLAGPFTVDDVRPNTGSLRAALSVVGDDRAFTVTASFEEPSADGAFGIYLEGALNDSAGNRCSPAASEEYAVANWRGFTAPLQDAKVHVGETYTLSVEAEYGCIAPAFSWWFEGGSKTPELLGTERSLTLTDLDAAAAGSYWCAVEYDGARYCSNTAVLSVADHVSIGTHPKDTRAYENDDTILSVSATGGHQPLSFVWRKSGEEVGQGATLALDTLREADSGIYTAEVRDSAGETLESTEARVEIRPHLRITKQPQGGTCLEGAPFSFDVEVEGGFQPLSYTWKRQEAVVGNGDHLGIDHVTAAHEGDYVVEVADSHTDVIQSQSTRLVVATGTPAMEWRGLLLAAAALWAAGVGLNRTRRGRRK